MPGGGGRGLTDGHFAGKMYPPKSESALRQLHQQVCEAPISIHHKQSVLYYLLLDLGAQGSFAQAFALESGMPTNYHIFMKGLWHMDRQDYQVRRRGPLDRPLMCVLTSPIAPASVGVRGAPVAEP